VLVEHFGEFLLVSSAGSQFCPIQQQDNVIPVEPGLKFFDSVNIDNRCPMNPHKLARPELLLHLGHSLAQQMRFAANVEFDIVTRRFYPIYFIKSEKKNASGGFHQDPIYMLLVRFDVFKERKQLLVDISVVSEHHLRFGTH